MFIRNENFPTFIRNYRLVTILIAIHFALYVWMNFLPNGWLVYGLGVGDNQAVAHGEYWRLLTPVFLHVGLGHLVFNSFSLIIFGPALEQMLGRIKFILAYLFSGIVANIATYFIGGLSYPYHLGASGAIFGLLGIYVYIVIYRKDLIDQSNAQLIVTLIIIGLVMTFVNSNINIFAHLFGFIAGAALSPMILIGVRPFATPEQIARKRSNNGVSFDPNRWQKKRRRTERTKKIIWIIFICLAILGVAARYL